MIEATILCGAFGAVGFAQPGAVVTETLTVRIDGKTQSVRKINGRYWSADNRELRRTNTNWLWTISGGNAAHLVRFDHHRPVDPTKVSLLDRSMGPDEVRSLLGPPNSVFPSDRPEQQQHWNYFGTGGYKLMIQFSSSGKGIFNASYAPDAASMPQDVPHLAFRFQGSTVREVAARRAAGGGVPVSRGSVTVPEAPREYVQPAAPAVPVRKITDAELEKVTVGLPRAKVIEILGEPVSGFSVAGSSESRETLEYSHERGSQVRVILVAGKVLEIRKP